MRHDLGVQPLPPITVNLPPASGPPWWVTALVALGSALLGIAVTAYLARGREHQKWLWERRVDLYLELVSYLNRTEPIRNAIRVLSLSKTMEIDSKGLVEGLRADVTIGPKLEVLAPEELEDLYVKVKVWNDRVLNLAITWEFMKEEHRAAVDEQVAQAIKSGDESIAPLQRLVRKAIHQPPSVISLKRWQSSAPKYIDTDSLLQRASEARQREG